MLTAVSIIALGFFLGVRHATDTDHVVAITTIVSRERSVAAAAWSGAIWGLGHTVTIVLVGGAIVLFNLAVPPRVGLAMELAVGVMLVGLGLVNLSAMLRGSNLGQTERPLPHSHAELDWLDWKLGASRGYGLLRPLVVGIVHGLAGSAAIALLVLTTIRTPIWAVAYLVVFGLGTIMGMVLVTTLVAVPFAYSSQRFALTNRRLQFATGLVSVGFGLLLAYQIGVLGGLFSESPNWTPR